MRKNSRQTAFQERNKGDGAELIKHTTLGSAADCQARVELKLRDV